MPWWVSKGGAKGDAGKAAMAARLRRETVMTVKRIAARLRMGTGHVPPPEIKRTVI
jgi:hypothetical protein